MVQVALQGYLGRKGLNEGSILFEQLNENNKATLELVEKVLSTKVYIEKQSKQLDFK